MSKPDEVTRDDRMPAKTKKELEPVAPIAKPTEYGDIVEACAKAAHEANRTYCAALGDTSQKPWEAASEWQRDSCLAGVLAILQSNATPEASHAGWLETKRAAGWQFGEVKDEVKKTHPCFVPYSQLPAEQRAKDAIFGAVVRGVAAAHGMKLAPSCFMF